MITPAQKREWLLANIYTISYTEQDGETETHLTDKEKMQYIADKLKSECYYDYTMKKFNNNYTLIIGYFMQGLPAYLHIPFENYKILELAKKWGYDVSTEKKEDKFLNNYFNNVANIILRAFSYYKIDYKRKG